MRRASVLALSTAIFIFAAEAPACARGPLLVGVQDDPVFVRLPSSYGGIGARRLIAAKNGYRWASQLGAQVLRITIHWATVEPGRRAGREDWSYYDAAIAEAHRHGFTVQVNLTGPAPAFATANHRTGVYRPIASFFAHFAAAAASRYGDEVQSYSIWNEPNWWDLLQPMQAAVNIYRQLYEAGYSAIKRLDPNAQVLIGELAPLGYTKASIAPLRFLRSLTCRSRTMQPTRRCKPLLADGFALHPYTLRAPPWFPGRTRDDVTTGSLSRLVGVLNQLADVHALSTPEGRPLDIYLTEYGWHAHSLHIAEPVRARYARDGFALAFAQPRVRQIVWYQLVPPPRSKHPIWDTALLAPHGRISLTFKALRKWVATMRAATATA